MIKKTEDMVREIKEQMRGGKGTVELTHIFMQDELKGKARICAKIVMEPGCSIGKHVHNEEEEIFYIISGKALIDDNGQLIEVKSGDAILTGNGASHAVENVGDTVLEMIAVILLY